jgi:hypothetical protein
LPLTRALICACNEEGNRSSSGISFSVQFNPNSINIRENVGHIPDKYSLSPDSEQKQTSHRNSTNNSTDIQRAQKRKQAGLLFSTKLFFNTYEGAASHSDVRALISPFYNFLNNGNVGKKQVRYIAFLWGSLQVFGRLSGMDTTYTMFSPNGSPVRAEVSIEITGDYVREVEKSNHQDIQPQELTDWPFLDFTAALSAFSSIDDLKRSARALDVENIRTGI